MINRNFCLLVASYSLLILALFLYCFTQVDLNLTLSTFSIWQTYQKAFIDIGYFNRPLSAMIFLTIVFLFFIFYFLFLWLVKKRNLKEKQVWFIIGLTSLILLFSYPAFSHDLFNYIFWARIFTHYGLSPYIYIPLDFPADSWTRFMHWTHVTYNHGPFFLLLSFIPSFLGFDKFLLTLFNFKLLNTGAFIGSCFLISKIAQEIKPKIKVLSLAFFGLNPLIIIESLISAHNDILMLFFCLLSIYLLIIKKNLFSLLFLLISGGMKFITLVFFPIYFLFIRKNLKLDAFLKLITMIALLAFIPVIIQREPYPWYLVTILGLLSFQIDNLFIFSLAIGTSLGLLMRYAPYLYFGDYNPPVPTLTLWLMIMPILITTFLFVIYIRGCNRKTPPGC